MSHPPPEASRAERTRTEPSADHTDDLATLTAAELVLVAYRSRGHVETLFALWPDELPVVVVDNSGDVDGLRSVVEARPHTRYVDGGGQGFARAANLGALSSTAEVVVFVNPDCRPTPAALAALVRGVLEDEGALSHAATMLGTDGEVESGVGGWEPTVRRVAAYAVGRGGPGRTFFASPRRGEHLEVDWTTGACMAVRSATFRALGGFDETFYVYCEDVAFGRAGRRAGLRSVLREDVTVVHGSGSSGAPSAEMLRLRGASFANYLRRYDRPLPAALMRVTMIAGSLLRAALNAARRRPFGGELAFVRGMVTRTAYVGGREVAAVRYAEVGTRSLAD